VLCLLGSQGAPEEVIMNTTRPQTRRNSDSAPAGRVQPADRRPGATPGPGQAKMPPRRTWLWFVLVLLANYVLMRLLIPSPGEPVTVPYTLFKEEVKKGNVKAIFSRGETIRGRFAAPVTYPPADEQRTKSRG
jgi:cell division protease FtsH